MNLQGYFKKARREKWAIGQFNFSILPQLRGIIEATRKLNAPIILGTSEGESRFLGLRTAIFLRDCLRKETGLSIFLNLDHGKSFEYLKKAIDLGYDMVHFDGSKLPLKENIKKTKEVVKYARKFGILVEGEVGIIGGDLTKSEEAKKYVIETDVDCLAINIGTFHGIDESLQNPPIRLDRLKEIKEKVRNTFLVLHGGSGTQKEDIKAAIKLGIVKININTELRLAFTQTLKKTLKENPEEIVPYKYLPEAINEVQKVVEKKIKLFGGNNKI